MKYNNNNIIIIIIGNIENNINLTPSEFGVVVNLLTHVAPFTDKRRSLGRYS
jgi:hypothetical protein